MAPGMFTDAYNRELGLLHPFLEKIRNNGTVDGPSFDKALLSTRGLAVPPAPAVAEDDEEKPDAKPSIQGVKARRKRRVAGEPSTCLLVRVVEEAAPRHVSPHQALLEAGFIRPLGLQALEG